MKFRNNELNTVSTISFKSGNVLQTSNVQKFVTTERNILKSDPMTVGDLKPEPKKSYTITYERFVLDDTFELSKLDPDVTLDLWLTNPVMPTPNVISTNANKYIEWNDARKEYDYRPNVSLEKIDVKGESVLRDLDSNVYTPNVFFEDITSNVTPYFATVAKMGIESIGPQEELIYEKNTDWTPKLLKHTNFSVCQKELKITTSPPYLGSIITIPINPRECGDLLCNMYFTCTLPVNVNYTPLVGRALMYKTELYFNEFLIQSYDDNWAVIEDELFKSADETLANEKLLSPPKIVLPLKFFFNQKNHYLPLCALFNQTVYLKFYFNTKEWFTDYPSSFDLIDPSIVFDQIFLTQEERLYLRNTKHELAIPTITYELPQQFTQGIVTINMTANFNVSMLVWFIRNVNNESGSDYASRYDFGYVSPLVNSYTNFVNWRGDTVNYVPVIDFIDIFMNNRNIVAGLTGDIYFTYKQPLEHGLSIPDKTMYVYCFSDEPKNPLKRGDFDFRTLSSKTTNMRIKFSNNLVPQLSQSYKLYVYYYGYKTLSIDKGFGVLLS
jgi:hypothetical protein